MDIHAPWYALLMFVGIALSAALWGKRFRAQPEMVLVYACALLGALVGAKLGYVFAEAPFEWDRPGFWRKMLWGKTILGALLGGYLGVEAGKKLIGYRAATGDFFAFVVPAGLVLGRIGCYLHGCCLGVTCEAAWWTTQDEMSVQRWPAPLIEAGFNALAATLALIAWRRGWMRGQLFHLYLMAYALFRLLHEPMRATPKYVGVISPYQVLALLIFMFAARRFVQRKRALSLQDVSAAIPADPAVDDRHRGRAATSGSGSTAIPDAGEGAVLAGDAGPRRGI